jgi:hypothetical protein
VTALRGMKVEEPASNLALPSVELRGLLSQGLLSLPLVPPSLHVGRADVLSHLMLDSEAGVSLCTNSKVVGWFVPMLVK